MAGKRGEEGKGEAVSAPAPAPVVTDACLLFGTESLLATFACLHGTMSSLNLVLLIAVQEHHQIRQGDGSSLLSSGFEMLAVMLLLALLFTGWWRRVLPFFALLMVVVTVRHSVRIFDIVMRPMPGICCYYVRAAVVVAAIAAVQLVLSFSGAKGMMRPMEPTARIEQP